MRAQSHIKITASLFLISITSCATVTGAKKSASDRASGASPASGEMILIQTGAKAPVISGSDKSHWLQLRESDSSGDKLYGQLATGEWQPAIEEARKELEKFPGDARLMVALGAAFASGKNYEMAGYYGGLALKTDQGNADAMNLIGLRVMMAAGNRRGDLDDAMSWFRKASDNDSTHIAALLNMGNLQLETGDASGRSWTT